MLPAAELSRNCKPELRRDSREAVRAEIREGWNRVRGREAAMREEHDMAMEQTASAATGHTVVGVFDGPNHAERALTELRDAGFSPDRVSVVARDTRASRDLVENSGMEGAETSGAAAGAVVGGLTGGIVGWLVGLGSLAVPGLGPVVAAGALATMLGGAAVGAVAGGLLGALVGAGVPEEEARGYEESVRRGQILLTVDAADRPQAERARQAFERHGGADVRAYGRGTTAPGGTTVASSEQMRD